MNDPQDQRNDDDPRRREFRRRQMFAQAQEHFTAGDFVAAQKSLKEIPVAEQTADIARLAQLVRDRLQEIAELHRDIRELRTRNDTDRLMGKLQRLLELQPGDERAMDLRNQLEEQAHPAPVATRSSPAAVRPEQSRAGKPKPPIRVSELEDEIWEFGQRMVTAPPPLPGKSRRPQPAIAEDDDLIPQRDNSSIHIWIAVAVSGFVMLAAIIVTTIILVMERK